VRTNEELHHAAMIELRETRDYEAFCELLHPDDSVYLDPLFGEYRGRQAIRDWLVPVMAKAGAVQFEELYPPVLAGDRSFVEWIWKFTLPDGSEKVVNRGCSVRQYADGWLVHAADYFDTHPLRSAEVRAIGEAAGATIDAADLPEERR
jgi:hypothetical protein